MNHSLINRIKMLSVNDFISGIKLLIALLLVPFYYFVVKNLWLICEDENEARDNGYWLFKYIREKQKDVNVIYAINKKSVDYKKVATLGKVCSYGSVLHWVYYLIAKYNISTQKGGKPNAAICYVLEVTGLLKNKRIFLQHGITQSDAEWLYYKNTKMRMFVCGARPEYDYIVKRFGYPEGYVKYVGFCRFDNLINKKKTQNKKRILVMPTWREWLVLNTAMTDELKYDGHIENTPYFKSWNSFLNNKNLIKLIEENDIELLFYPHRKMQDFLEKFDIGSSNIKMASWKDYDIQDLLINSDLLITDYSSVFFDFAYMKKPILFYQFDYEDFRKGQYKEGYFNFTEQKMGKVYSNQQLLIDEIENVIDNNFIIDKEAIDYINGFFELNDNKNCERTYNAIKEI